MTDIFRTAAAADCLEKGDYEEFKRKAREKISNFIALERKKNSLTFDATTDGFKSADSDTWIFPSVQMGLFDVYQGRPCKIYFMNALYQPNAQLITVAGSRDDV